MANPKRAGEEADRMIAEQNRLRQEQQAAVASMAAKASEELTAPAAAEVVSAAEQGVAEKQPDGVSAQLTEPRPAEIPDLALLRAQLEKSDQRWKVLQGMINKKDSEIETLRTLLAQVGEQKPQPAQPANQPVEVVTQQDVDDFGQDMIDLVTKVAGVVATKLVRDLDGKLTAEIEKISKVASVASEASGKTAKQVFMDNLTKRVPNWITLNSDPAFLEWLDGVDDFAGASRLDLLNDAYSRADLNRTAKFFEKFLEISRPVKQEVSTETPNPEKLIAPAKTAATTPVQDTSQKRVWSQADIKQLYADQRSGKISGEDFNKQERDLFAASREGRVTA